MRVPVHATPPTKPPFSLWLMDASASVERFALLLNTTVVVPTSTQGPVPVMRSGARTVPPESQAYHVPPRPAAADAVEQSASPPASPLVALPRALRLPE